MNSAHFHLIVNHLPIIFPMVGLMVLIIGLFLKSEIVKRTAMFIFIVGSLSTMLAMASGDGAEEVVERIQGIDEQFIETHEHAAKTFAIFSYALGFLALITLISNWKQQFFAFGLEIVTLIFCLIVLFFAKQTGTTGGEIRHSEIREAGSIKKSEKVIKKENEKHDDD